MSFRVRARKSPGSYMLDFYWIGEDRKPYRVRQVLPFKTEAAAKKYGERVEGQVRREAEKAEEERQRETIAGVRSKVLTLREVASLFVEHHLRGNLKKQSSIDSAISILDIHVLPFIGNKPCDKVTDDVIAELRSKWLKGGYPIPTGAKAGRLVKPTKSRKTISCRLSVISSLLHRAVEWKTRTKLAAMPCTIKMLHDDAQRTPEFYSHETYERIVEAARELGPRYLALVLLGGDAGLRLGEIIGLNVEDVDIKLQQLTPRRSIYRKNAIEYEDTPKGKRAVPVECTPRLLAALKAIRHLRGPRLFYGDEVLKDGPPQPLTQKAAKVLIKHVERKTSLPVRGKVHIFRHTFCSHLAMAGVPTMTIKELARHDDIKTTLRYMHLSPSAKKLGISMLTESRAAGGTVVVPKADRSG